MIIDYFDELLGTDWLQRRCRTEGFARLRTLGCVGTLMRRQGQMFFKPLSSKEGSSNIWPVDGLLGGECRVDWWWQRWVTTAVRSPGVNLLGKHSEDQSDVSWDMEKKKAIKALRLTFHITSGSLSSRRRVPIQCFHLNIFGEAANLSKSITWSRGRSAFAAKLPVCSTEVRISSADPDVVIQAVHLESLSQTASPCDVVS